MRVLGMISGTSHDGIDIAVVDFDVAHDRDGDVLRARIVHHTSVPYAVDLRQRLIDAMPPAPVGFDVVCELDTRIGQAFAAAASRAVEEAGAVDVVCTHGQTVFHWVEGGRALGTLQIGQPAWIAEATGASVVSDVRSDDIAAGGHGAPLVPLLDVRMLAPLVEDGAVAAALNLGGIANLTVCRSAADPVAWDIGPANALIDAVVTDAPGAATYDRDGELAATGAVDPALLAELLDSPYFAQPAPKSTGKELFNLGYVRDALERAGVTPALPDLVATLTELSAVTVSQAVSQAGVEVLVASGGGVRNPVLMRRLGELLPGVRVTTSDALGVPSDHKEAIAFALIGWASVHGLPGNVPSCTGADGPRVLGRISPRDTPPPAIDAWPGTLVFER
ncbi:anhydro-N-acetylmuramic acid kinase [Nocardioides panzhihuensis]|uniref:Anhydro-N-acetylmuramic acid kinase n=1 Tax=Nocardioides panzhihuensis TaxID=860243 RepID=A0A7Z0ISI7_9ACTN|nr:anhydro-N-acetylmuramic acid kinase [Nocardioides panzhihuensis]NYI78124.1 anhydro-N-acetylmuramic acid kinase [Nocardioides panzhihuensis]